MSTKPASTAQGAIRTSEMHYRRLFEAARDGILILDPSTRRITDANPFMTEILGYPHKELVGKKLWEIGVLHDKRASRSAFRELQKKQFIRYEHLPLQTKTGEAREVEFVSNVYDEDGRSVIQCNIRDISERKRAEEEWRRLRRRIVEAEEAERSRVACELQEGVNQILASAKMRLRKVEESVAGLAPGAADTLARCSQLLVEALEENRRIAYGLRPSDLDHLGLADACRHFCAEFQARTGLAVACRITLRGERLPPPLELNLFRIVQEGLGNIEKRAQATAASLRVAVHDGNLELALTDNGRDLEPEPLPPGNGKRRGLGLANIRERAVFLGGACEVKSVPGQGVTLMVRVPLREDLEDAGKTVGNRCPEAHLQP